MKKKNNNNNNTLLAIEKCQEIKVKAEKSEFK